MSSDSSTIVAVATPPGLGGVAIVRLSGPKSLSIAGSVFRNPIGRPFQEWPSHLLRYGRLVDPSSGELVDSCMAVYMRSPRTFTGEDVVEFHLHGSPLLCEVTVRVCTESGARLAQPGEFTQRAFLNGKLDLAQAESVLDLIESRTRAQARLASQHLEGRFSARVSQVREEILAWLSLLEAEIDFGDDIDEMPELAHKERLDRIQGAIADLLSDAQRGRVQVKGLKTVLVGAPNAGKSSLLNALLGEERALVTPIAGTTRDRIEVDCQLAGVLLNLSDTAGLRHETEDEVELLGMEKTRQAQAVADFLVLLIDAGDSWDKNLVGQPHLVFLNKQDRPTRVRVEEVERVYPGVPVVPCELLTEEGKEAAVARLVEVARELSGRQVGETFSLNERHREALLRARESLHLVEETLQAQMASEFVALDLRRAASSLGEILGLDVTEEVLDRIFGQFCLGK